MTATDQRAGSKTCSPRFATPRDERFPTLGPQVGEIARRLGKPLMPWQQDAADVAYEFDPVTGLFRYDEADITVPRQSGKTTITLAKKVHRLTALARKWGPQRSTYTAQTRLAARKKLERDFADMLRFSRSFREVPHAKARPQKSTEWRLSLNNGSESIQFGAGSFLQIDAPSRTGGHGDTLDDGTIDEAFAREDDTVEAGMRPAMATRKNAQLWVISTAGDARSKYLWRKILAGRAATLSGEHGRVCYIEYSADEDADPGDPATWWSCMPALGITIPEAFIRGEWERAQRKGQEGIDMFRRAYLNQWPEVPILDDDLSTTPFGPGVWENAAEIGSQIAGRPALAVSMTPDRAVVVLVAAGTRADGKAHVEVVEHGRSGDWFVQRVAEVARNQGAAVGLHKGHAVGALAPDLVAAGVDVRPITTGEYVASCGSFYDHVVSDSLRYPAPQPELTDAVARASRKATGSGDAWKWAGDQIAPLVAASQALWLHNKPDSGGGWMVSL